MLDLVNDELTCGQEGFNSKLAVTVPDDVEKLGTAEAGLEAMASGKGFVPRVKDPDRVVIRGVGEDEGGSLTCVAEETKVGAQHICAREGTREPGIAEVDKVLKDADAESNVAEGEDWDEEKTAVLMMALA